MANNGGGTLLCLLNDVGGLGLDVGLLLVSLGLGLGLLLVGGGGGGSTAGRVAELLGGGLLRVCDGCVSWVML